MVRRFKICRGMICAFALLVLPCAHFTAARAELLESLCRSNSSSPQVMQSLIEEAEATGMPPSTLNRLLIKGYHDRDSIKHLSRLLCVIVQAEEDGLPPGLLFQKLDEGLGKFAPLEKIIKVVEAKVADMQYVQALLSDDKTPSLEDNNVTRLTNVLSTGMTKAGLEAIFKLGYVVPTDMRVVAAEIKAYGRVIEFDASLLDRVIATGLASASLSEEWSFFIKVVSQARKQNITDRNISDEAVDVLSRKGSLDDLIASLELK